MIKSLAWLALAGSVLFGCKDVTRSANLIHHAFKDKTAGQAFFNKEDLRREVGSELSDKLSLPVIAVQRIGYFMDIVKSYEEDPWKSLYLPDPSPEDLYARVVYHEAGHVIFEQVKSNKLIYGLWDIDIRNEIYLKDSPGSHPAHPSFRSFFFCGFPGGDADLKGISASETYADCYALRMMGLLTDPDPLLSEKIDIINRETGDFKLRIIVND